eukprot:402766-Karenia_brevis.AAC.1
MFVSDQAAVCGNASGWLMWHLRVFVFFDICHRLYNDSKDGVKEAGLWTLLGVAIVVANSPLG